MHLQIDQTRLDVGGNLTFLSHSNHIPAIEIAKQYVPCASVYWETNSQEKLDPLFVHSFKQKKPKYMTLEDSHPQQPLSFFQDPIQEPHVLDADWVQKHCSLAMTAYLPAGHHAISKQLPPKPGKKRGRPAVQKKPAAASKMHKKEKTPDHESDEAAEKDAPIKTNTDSPICTQSQASVVCPLRLFSTEPFPGLGKIITWES